MTEQKFDLMSDEKLGDIAERDGIYFDNLDKVFRPRQTEQDRRDLLREVKRLRDENAGLIQLLNSSEAARFEANNR